MNVQNIPAKTHRNVHVALCAAQSQMGTVVKGSVNPAYKSRYADLSDVMTVVVPALTAHGIAVYHTMIREDGQMMMRTVLAHGETDTAIQCDVPLIVSKNDMQGMKSATTYAKRIGVESLTGIAPDDDDGQAAAKAAPKHDERPVVENPSAAALDNAWRDAVEDSLPPDATPRQKAEAYAEAIARDFKSKGMKALESSWNKRVKLIESMKERHPDLFDLIVDAYEMRRNELTDNQGIAAQ